MGVPRAGLTLATLPVLLSTFIFLLFPFAQPPPSQSLKPKVFVLGLSKTGTTSIGDALKRLGYRRLGWRDIRSRHMTHTFVNGDIEPLVKLTRYYDAFEDLPWPSVYKEMAELYPDSKFILSLRKDEETWLRSMRVHVGRGKWQPYNNFYGADTVEGNEAVILESYRNHTEKVRDYFKDKPERYMELSIDNGDVNWDVLCQVAQCPGGRVPKVHFPKSNTAAHWEMGTIINNLQWCWGWTVTRSEEQISQYYYRSGRTLLKPLLRTCWSIYDTIETIYSELYFQIMPVIQPPLTVSHT
ncbi:hypothetical protein CLAFUW4_00227 [Fulvia fulva]|uniref:Uncharacterized protein n=1 Tax=Passalora fulva TaxID=5499 RepID=A0A9Q8P491_PASFU|nr:uncharacterized protein CLAFUR5_00228 [Fulvia fulva]KAK4634470.1 hypothetical protein CLAFUR4_00227 [Fulvia fulva]KAK4637051.1 hypothetical protein CLAFUR0_00228 [Fulvia fulva]UJO12840.1 hypothetical protein CLAFUR5_00228 [Fulvia fulva]WPV08463.1 hypothetical protein CLAFUW4_00227 [Fulvia fulva]WPV23804.1 hypothetical protein CLAFUW7_00231 [Fulvia fulva]